MGPPNMWDRNKKYVYNALIAVVLVFAAVAYMYISLMQGATDFNAFFQAFIKSLSGNEQDMLHMAYYALERGLDCFRSDRIHLNEEAFDSVMQAVFGEWTPGSATADLMTAAAAADTIGNVDDGAGNRQHRHKYDASIRAINPNFMYYVLCTMHLLARVKQNKIDDRTNKVVESEMMGDRLKLNIQRQYNEAQLDFHFPVVNTRTGAIAILKVTMRSLPKQPLRKIHRNSEGSSDGKGDVVYYDMPAMDVESVSLCNPVPFVREFGSSIFDELPNRTLDKSIVFSWPRTLPTEVLIYKRDIVRAKSVWPSLFPPMLQPDMNSYCGHFVPYMMKPEHLCDE